MSVVPEHIEHGCHAFDLWFQGRPHLIAAGIIEAERGLVVIDPGPSTTLPQLVTGLDALGATVDDVEAVLLTHIHLDHAGATGALVGMNKDIDVYVHERGARHVEDPSRLLRSAERLYGPKLGQLWGTVRPVPRGNIVSLRGGERLSLGSRAIVVADTPGHAPHHVAYLDEESAVMFVGDLCGMRVSGCDFVLPQSPPPDVDIEGWMASISLVRAWDASWIFVGHAGPFSDVDRHLSECAERLLQWSDEVRKSVDGPADTLDESMASRFRERVFDRLRTRVSEDRLADAYRHFGYPDASWLG